MQDFPVISCHDILFNGQIAYYRHPADEPFSPETAITIQEDWCSVDEISVAYTKIVRREAQAAKKQKFAFDPEFGYLTPAVAWCGTGMSLNCDVHLEGLHLLGRLNQTLEALSALRITYDSCSLDGITHAGHMFSLENKASLGITDRDLCRRVSTVFDDLVRQETKAREKLIRDHGSILDDAIERSLAILKSARLLSKEEALDLMSPIALGNSLGFIDGISEDLPYELMFMFIDKIMDDDDDDDIIDKQLAEEIRKLFKKVKINSTGKNFLR